MCTKVAKAVATSPRPCIRDELAYDDSVNDGRRVFFVSFSAALLITVISICFTVGSVFHLGSSPGPLMLAGTRFAAYPYVMTALTVLALTLFRRGSSDENERRFLLLWIVVVVLGIVPGFRVFNFRVQYLVVIAEAAAAFVAFRIMVNLARPFYREARLARVARERSQSG